MGEFEKFIFKANRGKGNVSIMARGIIYLSSTTMNRYAKGRKSADLFFDGEGERIGIYFTEKRDAEGYVVSGESYGVITAAAFFNHYGIKISKTTHYQTEWDGVAQMLIINLKDSK